MNYKVLYRKYRPDSFDTLVGQKQIIEILKNSIYDQKIAHAYIFSGPRGTGKTSTARILAKAINCLNTNDGNACGKCSNCLNFNNSPDIIEIDAASNNGVNNIRELINNVKIMPTSLKYKIYIIDEVHMLSESAYNALLLTLEEPPEHVIFILATTNIESVPITILSRCQKFDFKRISQSDIVDRLQYICKEENIKYTEEALEEIAILSDGGLRDALSILDQLSKNNEEITLDLVIKEIGSVSNQKILELIKAIDLENIDKVLEIINDFRNINLNYKVVIKKMINLLADEAIKCLQNGLTGKLNYDSYKNMILELNEIINKINVNIDPYVLIEIILLKYVDNSPKKENTNKENIEQENSIKDTNPEKKSFSKEKKITKKPSFDNKKVDLRINNCFVTASKDNLNQTKELWSKFMEATKSFIKGLITDTEPVAASDKYIIVESLINHKEQELNDQLDLIEKSFKEMTNIDYKIIFINKERWELEKKKYINNLKSGYKYQYIDEATMENNNENEIEKIANNIFDTNKIEVE